MHFLFLKLLNKIYLYIIIGLSYNEVITLGLDSQEIPLLCYIVSGQEMKEWVLKKYQISLFPGFKKMTRIENYILIPRSRNASVTNITMLKASKNPLRTEKAWW